jgi:hypothetical protein
MAIGIQGKIVRQFGLTDARWGLKQCDLLRFYVDSGRTPKTRGARIVEYNPKSHTLGSRNLGD